MNTTKKSKAPWSWLALFTHPAEDEGQAGRGRAPAQEEGGLNPVSLIAALVTAASVALTAWSVYDLLTPHAPALVALIVGIGMEMVWLFALATEYQQARTGRTDKKFANTGWVLAAITAVVIFLHGALTAWSLVVLAAMPLAAKAGWAMRTKSVAAEALARVQADERAQQEREQAARDAEAEERAQQEREQALSTELTEQERQDIADLYRKANLARKRAEAEAELTNAEAEADRMRQEADSESERTRAETEHAMRQEAIRRRVEEQMAVQRANADLLKQKAELENELRVIQPLELGPAPARVPDDASSLEPAPGTSGEGGFAGFGSALQAVAATSTGTGLEQQVPVVPDAPGTHHSALEAEKNRAQVAAAYQRLQEQGAKLTIAAVARAAGVSDRAAGRHLRSLGLR